MSVASFAQSLADTLDPEGAAKLQAERDRQAAELRWQQRSTQWPTPGAFAVAHDPSTRQTPALLLLDEQLADVAQGRCDKLAFSMPPQEGKSERVSRRFPAWLLTMNPALRIGVASYEHETAVRWGRQIKRDIEDHPEWGVVLREDSQAAGRWETEQGGGLYCTGLRGAWTGRPFDVFIIDDPVKDRAAAESKVERERAWDSWENVVKVRARRVVLIMTRWHTDDLGGRLEQREGDEWRFINVPAIAETDDVLDREPGQEMESQQAEARPPGWFVRMRASMSSYVFGSLFQGKPTSAAGNLFKRGDWRYWRTGDGHFLSLDGTEHRLEDCMRFATIDLATSTRTSADYTVACAWAITPGGDLVLLDRLRDRVAEEDHAEFLAPLRQRWLGPYDVVYIESRMFGTTLVYAMGRAGVPVAELKADKDKMTRALAATPLVRQHRVWLPRDAPWLDEWIDEHADFDKAAHDDQVDNTAYAARVAIAHWVPAMSAEQERSLTVAADPDYVDLMTTAM